MSALTVAEVLERAADLIEPEGAWTQGVEARNSAGNEAECLSSDAACFCVGGAVFRAANGKDWIKAWRTFELLIGSFGPEWNDADERTQDEVVAKLREAAALAREQGK